MKMVHYWTRRLCPQTKKTLSSKSGACGSHPMANMSLVETGLVISGCMMSRHLRRYNVYKHMRVKCYVWTIPQLSICRQVKTANRTPRIISNNYSWLQLLSIGWHLVLVIDWLRFLNYHKRVVIMKTWQFWKITRVHWLPLNLQRKPQQRTKNAWNWYPRVRTAR